MITQFPKNGRLLTSFHHTINIWSHRKNFDHTINYQYHTVIILITPSKFWSHHLFSGSHRHNFVHTIKMLITLLKSCFTPSKFWSHHQFSRSHRHNFDHTMKMLITLLKSCFTPSKFWSHHQFSGSPSPSRGGSGTLLNRCRLHKTKKHTHCSNCSVTDLCSSTKQVYLGVITTDGCKNDRSSQVYI